VGLAARPWRLNGRPKGREDERDAIARSGYSDREAQAGWRRCRSRRELPPSRPTRTIRLGADLGLSKNVVEEPTPPLHSLSPPDFFAGVRTGPVRATRHRPGNLH